MRINLNAEDVFKKECEHMVSTLRESELPIIICGDVDECLYINFFKENSIIPVNVYDRSPELHGKKCAFGEIINIEDIERLYSEFNAVVVVPYFDEIKKVLMDCRSNAKNVFYLDIAKLHAHPTMFLGNARERVSDALADFDKLYEEFDDSESKKVWENIVNYWISGDYRLVAQYKGLQKRQYLDFFDLNDDEVFVNCGAFDGRYSKYFMALVNDKYKKVINFECDESNYNTLCKNMSEYQNVVNIKKGVYNKKTVLRFNANGNGMSCVGDDGNTSIEVDTLDNIFEDEKVTFIKMDIEGSEYAALEGACKVISRDAPKLAICIYHNIDDFIRIPRIIKSFNSKYKFAVRHYTDTLTETVLYAWV